MIFQTLSANGSTNVYTAHSGQVYLNFSGTFGSGTVVLEYQVAGESTWYAVEGTSFTSGPVSRIANVPLRSPIRATLSGATSPSLVVHIERV